MLAEKEKMCKDKGKSVSLAVCSAGGRSVIGIEILEIRMS